MERTFPLSIQEMMQDLKAIEQQGWDSNELIAIIDPNRPKQQPSPCTLRPAPFGQSLLNPSLAGPAVPPPQTLEQLVSELATKPNLDQFLRDHLSSPNSDGSHRIAQLLVSLVDQILPNSTSQLKQIREQNKALVELVSASLTKLNAAASHSSLHHAAATPILQEEEEEEEQLQAVLPLEATAENPEPANSASADLAAVYETADGWGLDEEDSLL